MLGNIQIQLDEIVYFRIDSFSNRPTIVFLHDSLGCIELWRDFPKKLGELAKCNVIVYDRQGYGRSCEFASSKRDKYYLEQEADILNALLDIWKINDAVLFGHSDGGTIALIMAAKYPSKIGGIITEGAHVFVEDITIRGINEAVRLYNHSNLKTKLEKYHGPKTEKLFWAWADTWQSEEFKNWNIESFLSSIHCDSLIIQGEKDEYGTLIQVERIYNQTSGKSEKLIVPDCGHTPHKEYPEQVLTVGTEFIEKIARGYFKN